MHILSFLLHALFVPGHAYALSLPTDWATGICNLVPCTAGGGASGLSDYLYEKAVLTLQVVFTVTTLIMMLLIYAGTMVFQSQDENVVKEMKTAYIYAITGTVIVSFASLFMNAFSPTETTSNLVNAEPLETGIGNIITFFKAVLAVGLSVNIVVQGFRLLASRGEQEQVEKARKRLIYGFAGVAIVLMAEVIVDAVNPEAGANSSSLAAEIRGIANFFITLFGFFAVVAIIVAGILLIVSVNENLKDKAKSIIKTVVFGIVAVMLSYSIVILFIGL